MVFMQGTNPLNRSTAFGVHAGYLYTGSWFETHSIPLPAGLNSNDVVMAYYDGSYNFLAKQGGTVLEGAAIDGEGKWHTITLTQAPTIGSQPLRTVLRFGLEQPDLALCRTRPCPRPI